jgi:hypothetical protein
MIRLKFPLLICFFLVLVATTWSGLGTMSVQLKTGQLRSTPSFLGAVMAEVAYGDQVDVMQQQGDWLEVRSPRNQTGWIHQSALTRKRVVLGTGGSSPQTAASGEEIALAGKGFNADVEAEFRRSHRNMDFTWVDRMEEFKVSTKEMISFLKAGGVETHEGGGR